MKIAKYIANRIMRNEESASKHINILSHYSADTLLDKSGKLIQIIKLSGLNFFTQDEQTLDTYKIRRNNLLKHFSSDFAFYFWEIKRTTSSYPAGEFLSAFAKKVNDKYQQKINAAQMFHTEHYLAVISKHPENIINKCFSIIKLITQSLDKDEKQAYLKKRYKELNDATKKIINSLSDYQCKLLTVYKKNNELFSAPLEFLSQLVNAESFSVPLNIKHAASILPKKRLFFNARSGTIEMRAANGSKKFTTMLAIKAYTRITYQGLLNELIHLKCQYVITQSFRFYDRQMAKGRMRDQQQDLMQSNDESISQTEQIDETFDDAASGEVGYGKHHFTLACYADSQEELNQHVGMIVSKFADIDIVCVREDVACELAFWAQLPGNFSYICRPADISTRNMASFASLHNYPLGKLKGNHWGDAVTVFETLSGSPYYFNFHYKDVGNFLIFGAMGSGKTVLVGFLILQSMKFGGKRIIFDKDRGLEIIVRAMSGTYERIKPGIRTGFNPCHLPDTLENRQFLSALFKKMLTVNNEVLSENDIEVIEHAIKGMYRLDKVDRQLCHIASFFGASKKSSLRARFDQWHSEGAYAWCFDNETDSLDLNANVIGFDLGHILADPICKTPILMYLTYRVEQAIIGERGMLFIDEGWLALGDDYFKRLIDDWSRTPRKKNNIFGLATQVANDTVHSSISKSINESAFCKIFFPNASANRNIYMDDFGLTEHEFYLIKTLPDDQYYFLLNHGRSTNKESVVLRANLTDLEDEIAIISAREETLLLMDQIIAEIGDDPKKWLPVFHEKRKGMKS